MKKKDLTYLIVAVVIFLVSGYVGYTQFLAPKKKAAGKTTVTVEKIGVIPAQLDNTAVAQLSDPTMVKDFSPPVDLTGLGNNAPFGP